MSNVEYAHDIDGSIITPEKRTQKLEEQMTKIIRIDMRIDEALYLASCLHGVKRYLKESCQKDDEFHASIAQIEVAQDRIQDAIVSQCTKDQITQAIK